MEELNITFTRMVLSLIAKESSLLWVESKDLRHIFKALNSTLYLLLMETSEFTETAQSPMLMANLSLQEVLMDFKCTST
jgi:hypothetical protein